MRRKALTRNQIVWHLDIGLSNGLQDLRNKFYCLSQLVFDIYYGSPNRLRQ